MSRHAYFERAGRSYGCTAHELMHRLKTKCYDSDVRSDPPVALFLSSLCPPRPVDARPPPAPPARDEYIVPLPLRPLPCARRGVVFVSTPPPSSESDSEVIPPSPPMAQPRSLPFGMKQPEPLSSLSVSLLDSRAPPPMAPLIRWPRLPLLSPVLLLPPPRWLRSSPFAGCDLMC